MALAVKLDCCAGLLGHCCITSAKSKTKSGSDTVGTNGVTIAWAVALLTVSPIRMLKFPPRPSTVGIGMLLGSLLPTGTIRLGPVAQLTAAKIPPAAADWHVQFPKVPFSAPKT